MHYIVFDLELNSKPFKNRHPNEIIEIGAVKLDGDLKTISTFQAFVRPKLYKKLFAVVKRKTHILQEDINHADAFEKVYVQFRKWIGEDYILCSWGHDDIHHLRMNCRFHRLGSKWIKTHIDIQKHFSRIYGLPLGQAFSLKNALAEMELTVCENLHRAMADARYTADVFAGIYDRLEPKPEQEVTG